MKSNKRKTDNINIDKYFNRKYEFVKDATWNLPDTIYTTNKFIIEKFQDRKNELNTVKEQLSDFNLTEWSKHTRSREPTTSVINTVKRTFKGELVTQAWCKFYECLSEYPVISQDAIDTGHLNSVHICEAPGAFICALNHYLQTYYSEIKWNWLGSTLNPYYEGNLEMIPDDRLIRFTYKNWYFGQDLTGDIMKYYNHKSLVDLVNEKGKVQLVTADGSIDCMENPGDQEKIVEFLHYCEVMTAFHILETGGSFVIKTFTMFEESTICLMYLLNCCFEKVHVFKPCTSKSGNSELYIICLNYKPPESVVISKLMMPYIIEDFEKSMFSLSSISESFLSQIYECGVFFMERQIKVINENVKYFKKNNYKQSCWIKELRSKVGDYFEKKYNISILSNEFKIVKSNNINNQLYYMAQHFLTNEEDILETKIIINEMYPGDISSIFEIQIGRYIETITHSKYHTITNFSYEHNRKSDGLYKLALSILTSKMNIIAFTDFQQLYGVSKFHRKFFLEIFNKFNHEKDILVVGVPLLTNFLVGLIFLVSLAFEEMTFLNNLIILKKPDYSKVNVVRKCLEVINETYLFIDNSTDVFTRDILFLVPLKYTYNKRYVKFISMYNDNILKYRK